MNYLITLVNFVSINPISNLYQTRNVSYSNVLLFYFDLNIYSKYLDYGIFDNHTLTCRIIYRYDWLYSPWASIQKSYKPCRIIRVIFYILESHGLIIRYWIISKWDYNETTACFLLLFYINTWPRKNLFDR